MSAEDTALVALANHCIDCAGCTPDVDRPEAEKPTCPEGMRLYRAWRQACRDGAPAQGSASSERSTTREIH